MSENGRKIRELTEAMRAEGRQDPQQMVAVPYMPTATRNLSASKSVRRDAECGLAAPEHYETREDLTHAVPEYFGTYPIRLDIYRFVYRCV